MAILTVTRAAAAQTCLGRPPSADVKFSVGVVAERQSGTRTSIVPRVGMRSGPAFAALGAGPQWHEYTGNRTMRWQGVLGTALGDENASAISWCPLVRIEAQREPAHYGVDARMTGTLEAGMSMGARFSRGGQSEAIWRFDFGWRHTPRQPSDGEATNNEVVVGTGISLVVYRHLAMDAFLRGSLSVPGSGQGLFGLGLTVGRQR